MLVLVSVLLLAGAGQALDPLVVADIQAFGLPDMLGESSQDAPPATAPAPAKPAPAPADAALAPAPAPKAANQQAEMQMAEVEWKDAYDSTVAPGKLQIPITRLPNASDRTWMKQIVESVKKGDEKKEIKGAGVALHEAEHLMQDIPEDEPQLPKDKGNTLAATVAMQEKSANDLKEVVKKFTAADPVTQDAQKKLEKLQHETEQAEQRANTAKAALEAQAKAAQDKLVAEHAKEKDQVKVLTKAKTDAMREAAAALAQGTQASDT